VAEVVSEAHPDSKQFDERSPLDELVREGARKMLQEAINAEVEAFIGQSIVLTDDYAPVDQLLGR